MGHGFSRMLQMVNDDIMRSTNTDNINSNLFINPNMNNLNNNNFNINNSKDNQKEDENNSNIIPNNNSNINNVGNLKLPKVKNKASTVVNMSLNTNQSLNNFDKEKYKDEKGQRMMTTPYDDHSLSTSNLNRPQIMKIYKLNKNSSMAQNNNINNNKLYSTNNSQLK